MPSKSYYQRAVNADKEAVTVMFQRADVQAMRQAAVAAGFKSLSEWVRSVLPPVARRIVEKKENGD